MEGKKILIVGSCILAGLIFLTSQLGGKKYEKKLEERQTKEMVSPKVENPSVEQPATKPKQNDDFSYSERKMISIIGLFIDEMEQSGYSMGLKRYLYQKDGFTVEILVDEGTIFEFDSRSWAIASISLRVPQRDNHSLGLSHPNSFDYFLKQEIVVLKVGDRVGFREEYTFHETAPHLVSASKNFCEGDDIVFGNYDCQEYFWNKFQAHAPKFVSL